MILNALVTDRFLPQMLAKLKTDLGVTVQKSLSTQPTADELKTTHILLIRSKTLIHKKLLQQAPQLQLIISCTAGYDHIHIQDCYDHNIPVLYTPDAHTECVAELTFLFLLELHRRSFLAHKLIHNALWRERAPMASEINNTTLGLIGFGRIGQSVSRKAQAVQMHVQAYDPYVDDDVFIKHNTQRIGLTELLRTSDTISLHCSLTPETSNMINHRTLLEISPECFLINTARGELICEDALIDSLEQQRIKAVALDVFQKEPLAKNSRLKDRSNVLLTPHIGAYTDSAFLRSNNDCFNKIYNYVKQGQLSNQLTP